MVRHLAAPLGYLDAQSLSDCLGPTLQAALCDSVLDFRIADDSFRLGKQRWDYWSLVGLDVT
jgi:hypothetical protein